MRCVEYSTLILSTEMVFLYSSGFKKVQEVKRGNLVIVRMISYQHFLDFTRVSLAARDVN